MMKILRTAKGQAFMEYIVLIVFVLSAFLVLQQYISRALAGRWRQAGDSFGAGRQFDPVRTRECAFDVRFGQGWYNVLCYEENCDCDSIDVSCGTDYCDEALAEHCFDCIVDCKDTDPPGICEG